MNDTKRERQLEMLNGKCSVMFRGMGRHLGGRQPSTISSSKAAADSQASLEFFGELSKHAHEYAINRQKHTLQ